MTIKQQVVRALRPYAERLPWLAAAYRGIRERNPDRFGEPTELALGFRFAGYEPMLDGSFEPHETAFIVSELASSSVFVDIGANIGYFACLARSRGVHTIAVEPLESNLQAMYRNVQANDWSSHLEVFPVGLAGTPSIQQLFGVSTGASLIAGWAGADSRNSRLVPISTLDIILANRFANQQMLIKVDVEGAELRVLDGATATLVRKPQPHWLVEVNFRENRADINPDFLAVFDRFWSNGYEARTVEDRRVVRREDVEDWLRKGERGFGSYNFLFLPKPLS